MASGQSPSEAHCGTNPRGQDPGGQPPPDNARSLIRSFKLFEQPKSTREVNEAIKLELLKAHPATEGSIYGFLHAHNVRVRIGTGPISDVQLIKIGRSVNVERRMKEWKKQCKYEPHVVLEAKMHHHCRVERIVHHQLHNSRLREHPGCAGCRFQHNEWFRVNVVDAELLVGMWQDFARGQPYDEFGALLPNWIEKLDQLDLDDPGCWTRFTSSVLPIGPLSLLDHNEEYDENQTTSLCLSSDRGADESTQ